MHCVKGKPATLFYDFVKKKHMSGHWVNIILLNWVNRLEAQNTIEMMAFSKHDLAWHFFYPNSHKSMFIQEITMSDLT